MKKIGQQVLIFYTTSAQLVSYPQDTRCPTPPLETRMDSGFQISPSRSETFRASLSRRELFRQCIFRLPRFAAHKENSTPHAPATGRTARPSAGYGLRPSAERLPARVLPPHPGEPGLRAPGRRASPAETPRPLGTRRQALPLCIGMANPLAARWFA